MRSDPTSAYWNALCRGDTSNAIAAVLDLERRGVSVADILETVVAPAQAEVGRRWATNEWTVAEEHRATSISEDVVAALARRVPAVEAGRGTAVVSCVDGDWHALPARMLTLVLSAGGWRVHHLGPSVPVSQLIRFVQELGPDVVALSCSLPTGLRRARAMIEACRDGGVPVIVGGSGFGPDGRWGEALGANAWAATAGQAADMLRSPSWPAFTGPAPDSGLRRNQAEVLARARSEVVSAARAALPDCEPEVRPDGSELTEDLGLLVDALVAAVLVDDSRLYDDFVDWMLAVRASRSEPADVVLARVGAVGRAAAEAAGPLGIGYPADAARLAGGA